MKVRLPKGAGGAPQDMNAMLKQAQKMQQEMAETQAELETREYEISAGGGAVTVRINGGLLITDILIKPEIIDADDAETLQDILVAGVNEAIKKVNDIKDEEMSKLTGGMPF